MVDVADLLGHDPYDALRGRRIPPWVHDHARARQLVIQTRKRVPVDLSKLLGIEPFVMAKAAACFTIALTRDANPCDESVRAGLDHMAGAGGNLGHGRWGYEFDVQTRWGYYPVGAPNLIATAFCGRALLASGVVLGDDALIAAGRSCADALCEDFLRDIPGVGTFFAYTSDSMTLIHNANALGSAIVAAAGVLTNDRGLVDIGHRAIKVTEREQDDHGAWDYGVGRALGWKDSFHTAYLLDSLHLLTLTGGGKDMLCRFERGIVFWVESFFGPDGAPYYYSGGGGCLDIHSAATAVDVLSRLASWGLSCADVAERVHAWTLARLIAPDGGTYYRRCGPFTDRRRFVRWGDAHWRLACASKEMVDEGRRDPLEIRLADMAGSLR